MGYLRFACHVPILADPTLLMTKRGLEWLLRATASQIPAIRYPKTYIVAESGGFTGNVDPYWRRGALGGRRSYYGICVDLTDAPGATSFNADAASWLRLDRLKPPDREVIAEIWSGLMAGDWLVARRFVSFEALAQAGVTATVRGPDYYYDAFAEATRDHLPPSLAAALDRRIRFVATVSDEVDQFGRPMLSIYDSGQRTYY
jgi:hypothetical protein